MELCLQLNILCFFYVLEQYLTRASFFHFVPCIFAERIIYHKLYYRVLGEISNVLFMLLHLVFHYFYSIHPVIFSSWAHQEKRHVSEGVNNKNFISGVQVSNVHECGSLVFRMITNRYREGTFIFLNDYFDFFPRRLRPPRQSETNNFQIKSKTKEQKEKSEEG